MLERLLAKGLEAATVFAGTEDEMTLGELRMTIAETSENLAIDETVGRIREQLKSGIESGGFRLRDAAGPVSAGRRP